MFSEIWGDVWYFVDLTTRGEVFWTVLPLLIATIVTVIYFQKYKDERAGWNTYFANSLVLIFVSMILFRYIYSIGIGGVINYIENPLKTFAVIFLLVAGLFIARLNFGHILPEKIARIISSPLTVNLLAYVIILFVYSDIGNDWEVYVSLLIIFLILLSVLNLMKIPTHRLFVYLQKLKRREKIENIKEERFEIEELKRELSFKEGRLKNFELKKLDREKKDSVKIKKIIKKELKKKRR